MKSSSCVWLILLLVVVVEATLAATAVSRLLVDSDGRWWYRRKMYRIKTNISDTSPKQGLFLFSFKSRSSDNVSNSPPFPTRLSNFQSTSIFKLFSINAPLQICAETIFGLADTSVLTAMMHPPLLLLVLLIVNYSICLQTYLGGALCSLPLGGLAECLSSLPLSSGGCDETLENQPFSEPLMYVSPIAMPALTAELRAGASAKMLVFLLPETKREEM